MSGLLGLAHVWKYLLSGNHIWRGYLPAFVQAPIDFMLYGRLDVEGKAARAAYYIAAACVIYIYIIVTSDNVTLPITNVVGARIMRYVMSQNGSRLFWALTMAFFKKRCHLILRYRLLKHCHHSQSHSQSLFVCKCLKHPFTGNIKSPLEAMCT